MDVLYEWPRLSPCFWSTIQEKHKVPSYRLFINIAVCWWGVTTVYFDRGPLLVNLHNTIKTQQTDRSTCYPILLWKLIAVCKWWAVEYYILHSQNCLLFSTLIHRFIKLFRISEVEAQKHSLSLQDLHSFSTSLQWVLYARSYS